MGSGAGRLDARSDLGFLAGGGEMGRLMRAFDWSATPLGPASAWAQSLRSAVSILLPSKAQIALFWGPELITLYNDAYRPVFGAKHPHALGLPIRESWGELWRAGLKELFEDVLHTGEAYWAKDRPFFMERHGFAEETYFDVSYDPVRDESGGVGGVFCIVSETTARVLGERRLQVLRDLASATSEAGSVGEAQEACARVLCGAAADVPFALIYSPSRSGQTELAAHAGLPPGLASRIPPASWDGGEERCVEGLSEILDEVPQGPWPERPRSAVVLPLADRAQAPALGFLVLGVSARLRLDDEYLGFFHLVARQVAASIVNARATEQARARADALAELDRAKTVFFSNVSHEFRTPLTLMLGPLEELVAQDRLADATRERLGLVHRNALRLHKLVNSLLEFSRLEAGRVEAAYEPVDLARLTVDLASTFRSAIERAGLHYEVSCGDLGEPVHVDREMWEKIVLNLVSNAFKFTLAGRITVRLRRDAGEARLEVADTGVGIPEHEIGRLFERFYRVEDPGGRTAEGSGIGLALVHELVKLHGGRIEVVSTPGVGSTFIVRIRLGAAHLPREAIHPPRTGPAAAAGAQAFVEEALRWLPDRAEPSVAAIGHPGGAPRLDRRFAATFGSRIVLADDNDDMRAYLRELLAPYYRVEVAGDGRAALAAIRREPPALVVSDVMMPRLDGFGLVKALREDPLLARTPVLLLSARAGEEARIEGLDAGADDYLIKPFSARELLARIGALVERDLVRRDSEERLRRALQKAPGFICILQGPDHRYAFINDATVRVFGRREILGRPAREAFPELEGQGIFEELDRVYSTGERFIASGMPLAFAATANEPARELHLDFIYEPMRDEAGRVTGIFVEGFDVTEQWRAREALEAASRQKDEFLAMLAHELRNPLASIRNAGELLSRLLVDDRRAQAAVGMVRRQGEQLSRLVDDLLDVSRITQGRVELKREPVELGCLVAQAAESVEPLFREKRQTLTVEQHARALHVDGDSARLVQCFVNLLTNAAKYTDPGGRISIRTYQEGESAVVAVADTGIGIPPELLPRVFDLFVQNDRTLDRSQGGLGIGLSVVRHLAAMHGGSAHARSDGPGRGSTFEIRLPLIEPVAAPAPPRQDRKTRSRRVLIVDDNVDAADSLAMLLRLDNHEVQSVYGPREALERVPSFRPDIILLDIGLPEMDGYEVARLLRTQPELDGVRLVALTGYGQAEDKQRSRTAGFDSHLVKPVAPDALARALG